MPTSHRDPLLPSRVRERPPAAPMINRGTVGAGVGSLALGALLRALLLALLLAFLGHDMNLQRPGLALARQLAARLECVPATTTISEMRVLVLEQTKIVDKIFLVSRDGSRAIRALASSARARAIDFSMSFEVIP